MFVEEVPNSVTLSAVKHLLEIKYNAIQLDESRSKILHSITFKLLYIMKRSQHDLESTFAFLCMRVSNID